MFDVDELVVACRDAAADPEPRLAIRDVLERGVADPGAIAEALPPTRAEIVPLHVSPEVTVLKVVWAPGMLLGPHDHRMWAAIGVYSGGEDNRFYRRHADGLDDSGDRSFESARRVAARRRRDPLRLQPDRRARRRDPRVRRRLLHQAAQRVDRRPVPGRGVRGRPRAIAVRRPRTPHSADATHSPIVVPSTRRSWGSHATNAREDRHDVRAARADDLRAADARSPPTPS